MLHDSPQHGSGRASEPIDGGATISRCQRQLKFPVRSVRQAAAVLICTAAFAGFSWPTAVWSAPPTPGSQQLPASKAKVQQPAGALNSQQAPLNRRQAARASRAPQQDGETAAIMARLNSSSSRSNQSSGDEPKMFVDPGRPRNLPPVTDSDLEALQQKIHRVLSIYFPKHQNTRDNSAWEIMHEIIAFGVDSQLFREGPHGPKVNAIGWLCYNGVCRGEQMMYLDRGQIVARKGVGVQGHYGQFLAILAQSRLPIDYPMLISGKTFTIADLVEHEKMDCQPGEELTFKLIGLMHYLDSEATWTSRYGETWSISRLITEELRQPIRGAACGGTHRLMGFSYAVNKRILRGKEVTGEFARAQKFINQYHRYTFSLQNADGSFSTQWFTRREADPDVDRRLKTTGHIAEWLSFSLSDEEVRRPEMVLSANYLANILLADPNRKWEIGPLGHGLHALAMYDRRLSLSAQRPQLAAEPVVIRLPEVTDEPADRGLTFLQEEIVADDPAARAAHQPCPAKMCRNHSQGDQTADVPAWEMPRCQIGNEMDEAELAAPDSAIRPGDADDEICL